MARESEGLVSILSGTAITQYIMNNDITITPLSLDNINPASIDLRLGNQVAVYTDWVTDVSLTAVCGEGLIPKARELGDAFDIKKPPDVRTFDITDEGWVLNPGVLYLMHTEERVRTNKFVPVLDGKSSIGRLGITVHITAGFGDPGYDGQYTLEVMAVHPIRVYAGMRFCQMRFHRFEGELTNYQKVGSYRGKYAMGPVPSQAYKQFK